MKPVAVDWEMVIAATAKYYGWAPGEVLALRLSELFWWHRMAQRMEASNG